MSEQFAFEFIPVRLHLLILAAVLWLGIASPAAEAKGPRPNIVMILADDFGYSDLGSYGSVISTLNPDRVAAEGLQMTQSCNGFQTNRRERQMPFAA